MIRQTHKGAHTSPLGGNQGRRELRLHVQDQHDDHHRRDKRGRQMSVAGNWHTLSGGATTMANDDLPPALWHGPRISNRTNPGPQQHTLRQGRAINGGMLGKAQALHSPPSALIGTPGWAASPHGRLGGGMESSKVAAGEVVFNL